MMLKMYIIYDWISSDGLREEHDLEETIEFETWEDWQHHLRAMRHNGCYHICAEELW